MAPLPSYKKPPVNEVVFGMRFNSSEQLKIPYIGLLWENFKADYPKVQHVAPITMRAGQLSVDPATGAPIPRVWFINEADDELFQYQADGFYFNWRHRDGDYPRYEHTIAKFLYFYTVIKGFYKEHQLGEIEPIEYELTYINHIPKGSGWESIEELPKVFSKLNWVNSEGQFLPPPDGTSWQAVFLLPKDKGRLVVSLKKGTLTENKQPVLIFELKVIGFDNPENLRSWFDLSREWIVRGFTDLTTPEMHKLWEKE